MMRKIQIGILMLAAVFACGALAASAFAEGEWLAGGLPITTGLATETTGELQLSVLVLGIAAATVLCPTWTRDGAAGPGASDVVTEILNAAKELVTELEPTSKELALDCEVVAGGSTCGPVKELVEYFPVNLYLDNKGGTTSWTTKIILVNGAEFWDVISGLGTLGEPGWEVLCLKITVDANGELLADMENRCIGKASPNQMRTHLTNGLSDVIGSFNTTSGEEAECTTGSGMLVGEELTTLNSGEALQVS